MTAPRSPIGTVRDMPYSSDLTEEQWALLEPVFNTPGKRGPKHGADLRSVVDAMLYISHTGCQWRFLPESFGPWTRVWSQFRRWTRNGTWARTLTVLHEAARAADGRAHATPSMVVIDTHLARGASNGGLSFHDRGGPYGRTKGAKRIVAVDVTGLPVGALVVPASTHENRTAHADWRSRSRTPPARPPAGYRSPALRPRCGTAPGVKPVGSHFRSQHEHAGLGPTRATPAACVARTLNARASRRPT